MRASVWFAAAVAGAGLGLAPAAAHSAELVGAALRVEGKVEVAHIGKAWVPLLPGDRLYAGDRVRTGKDGRALLRVGRARVMLAPGSAIVVRGHSRVRFSLGEAFFRVLRKVRTRLEFRVETKTAVLGVRGTTFSVAGRLDRLKVLLKEGKVEARAVRGRFKRHKGPPPSFAEFVAEQRRGVEEMQREFEAFVEQTQKEFAAFVRSIVLEAGQGLVLAGQDAWTFRMTKQDEQAFAAFESWLQEVQ